MTNQDVIDGWKTISTYVGKSIKTIQRWEKESHFPVHRVPGRQSVFAIKSEVDEWLERQTKAEEHFGNEKQSKVGRLNSLFRPRRVSPVVLVLIIIALGAIAIQSLRARKDKAPVLGPLTVKIIPYSEGSILTVTNGVGTQAFKIKFDMNWCWLALRTPGTRMWKVSDVNNDGLDDFLFVNPEKTVAEIDLLLQHSDGRLKLERTITIRETIHYQETTFEMERIQYFDLMDLDGDHFPELLISAANRVFYPALLLMMTLQGERLLVVEHPGWFRNLQVHYVNGNPVVYVSGTNNFITKYSEPVLIRISMDWHRRGVRFSFLRPDRKMADIVSEGVSVTYARLGDFPGIPGTSPWENAVIRSRPMGTASNHLMVEVGYYDSRIGKVPLPGSGPLQEIRRFELKKNLSLMRAEYNDVVKDIMGIHPNQEPFRSLLTPHYWNGHDWQDTICSVPEQE